MTVDLSCIIYTDIDRDELLEKLSQLFPVQGSSGTYCADNNEVEIVRNLDYDPVRRQQFPDGFLNFRQRIEIFPDQSREIPLKNQLALVSMILKHLWSQNVPAVAACDYEEQLPNNGGYKSTEIPWEKISETS